MRGACALSLSLSLSLSLFPLSLARSLSLAHGCALSVVILLRRWMLPAYAHEGGVPRCQGCEQRHARAYVIAHNLTCSLSCARSLSRSLSLSLSPSFARARAISLARTGGSDAGAMVKGPWGQVCVLVYGVRVSLSL